MLTFLVLKSLDGHGGVGVFRLRASDDNAGAILDGCTLEGPRAGDFRRNLHVGGRPFPGELDQRDRQICDRLTPRLRDDGRHFVGIDVIGGMLTEVNVTSPTGLTDVDRLCGTRLATQVIEFVEDRVPQAQA